MVRETRNARVATELDGLVLGGPEIFVKSHIEVDQPRAGEQASARIAEVPGGRPRESGRIEPRIHSLWIRSERYFAMSHSTKTSMVGSVFNLCKKT